MDELNYLRFVTSIIFGCLFTIINLIIYVKHRKSDEYAKKFLHISYAMWFLLFVQFCIALFLIAMNLFQLLPIFPSAILILYLFHWAMYWLVFSGIFSLIPALRRDFRGAPLYYALGMIPALIFILFTDIQYLNNGLFVETTIQFK